MSGGAVRDDPRRPGRGSRTLWIAAAIALFLLLLWWAARAYRVRDAVPAETPGTPSSRATVSATPALLAG